jgi:FkbM family methyltransferase
MKRFIKNQIKKSLQKRGHELLWTPSDQVSGLQLARDLPLLLPSINAICFDVGANSGQTIELLQQALNVPIIHSFEPTPEIFVELKKKNWGPNVHLHNIALGSSSGVNQLNLYELSVLNSLLPLETTSVSPFANIKPLGTTRITVSTVDEFAHEKAVDTIDLLKIDTQGFDFEVLKGAENLFAKRAVRHVLVELNYIKLYERQSNPWEIEAFLAAYGFRLVDLYEKFRSDQSLSWCTALFRSGI